MAVKKKMAREDHDEDEVSADDGSGRVGEWMTEWVGCLFGVTEWGYSKCRALRRWSAWAKIQQEALVDPWRRRTRGNSVAGVGSVPVLGEELSVGNGATTSSSYRERSQAGDVAISMGRAHRRVGDKGHDNMRTWYRPPVLSTCPLHTDSECGKERRILIGPW